jgi:peptidoglycan/xylan/chitin deacetylase (PgdA/CDA1 family)
VILNFHGIGEPGRAYEPGERRYWLSRAEFTRILDLVSAMPKSIDVRLSVDDGNRSDFEIIAPELKRRGLTATFFILAGKLDKPGYLQRSHVTDLARSGFEIGSHGLDHVDWAAADHASLQCEISKSKQIIESLIGRPVTAAAAPFGSYDCRVLRMLAHHGYCEVYSSDGGPRLTTAWPTPRQSLVTGLDIETLRRRVASYTWRECVSTELRVLAKSLLPHSLLDAGRMIKERLKTA